MAAAIIISHIALPPSQIYGIKSVNDLDQYGDF